ncbi:MAG: LacI family DNA-binding transcriptional regulator [Christensenellales bacterium]
MIRLKDVAASCGVSIATVSKALNAMPGVGEETVKRVWQAAQEMGYLPNAAARALKTRRTRNIGVLLFMREGSPSGHEYVSRILSAIQEEAEGHRYDITLISRFAVETMGSYLNHCRSRSYDGLILMSGSYDEPTLMDLIRSDIPLVTIDAAFEGHAGVLSDNRGGMRDLMQHILARGHRRVAFIHGENTSVTQDRIISYLDALAQARLPTPPEYLRPALFHDPQSSARQTQALLDLAQPPTCILYPDDFSLLGGKTVLEQRGLRVPDDISIAGYDGILLSQVMHPKVCTLQQDAAGIGQSAMQLLRRAIEEPAGSGSERLVLPGKLLQGESVALIPPAL